jgi:threonine/homoserine/homoserine lactone efflux protein
VTGHVVAFLGVSALVIVTPGQDTALRIRNALLGGRRAAAFTALGVSAGQAAWALAAAAGVSALLRASEPAFVALRIAGAAYLVFLGAQALLGARHRRAEAPGAPAAADALPAARAFRQGLLSNLGNPKMAIFFTSLLPPFAGGSFAGLLALGLAFSAMTLTWLTAYGIAVSRARDVLRRARPRRVLDAIAGTALVALGIRLAADS